jgi:hypothetical protein
LAAFNIPGWQPPAESHKVERSKSIPVPRAKKSSGILYKKLREHLDSRTPMRQTLTISAVEGSPFQVGVPNSRKSISPLLLLKWLEIHKRESEKEGVRGKS